MLLLAGVGYDRRMMAGTFKGIMRLCKMVEGKIMCTRYQRVSSQLSYHTCAYASYLQTQAKRLMQYSGGICIRLKYLHYEVRSN